jgi:hypothetical protein
MVKQGRVVETYLYHWCPMIRNCLVFGVVHAYVCQKGPWSIPLYMTSSTSQPSVTKLQVAISFNRLHLESHGTRRRVLDERRVLSYSNNLPD